MGKFVVKETKTGYKFDLKASNGEIIATSEVYKSESACLNGIDSSKKNAPIANVEDQTEESVKKEVNPKFEVYIDKAGEFRFRLKARNGEIIAVSEGYKSKGACLGGIESVRENAADSEVVKKGETKNSAVTAVKSDNTKKSADTASKTGQASKTNEGMKTDKKTGGIWGAIKRFFGVK